jgi:hypothetical protein
VNDYLQGSIREQIRRGQTLLLRIPRGLPREFHLLDQTCRKQLQVILDGLESVLTNPRFHDVRLQPERLREFRRLVQYLSYLETSGVAALERATAADVRLNQLIDRIRTEIGYPLLPPVVSCLSQDYFHTHMEIGLVRVPLGEADFLLHLPDLYHELAHPLLTERHDPQVKPFQAAAMEVLSLAARYFDDQHRMEQQRRGPALFEFYLGQWERSWPKWIIEFFCDLFAVYTLGPAYVWSHLHLVAKHSEDPFYVPAATPRTHPADDARMQVMLKGLQASGFVTESAAIATRWQGLMKISLAAPEPEYVRCYPKRLLESMVQQARVGVAGMRCRIAEPDTKDIVHSLLNGAWQVFWDRPIEYVEWEGQAIAGLQRSLATSA